MLNSNKHRQLRRVLLAVVMVMCTAMFAFAAATNFSTVYTPIVDLVNSFRNPFVAIVVAVGGLYCIVLGIKYAQAEEPQERQKAKQHLKNAVIGYLLIFVLMFALNRLTPIMEKWVDNNMI